MSLIVDRAIDIAKDTVQTALCNAGGLSRIATDYLPGPFGDTGNPLSRRAIEARDRAMKRYCDVPPPESVDDFLPGPVPFDGGQCSTTYRIRLDIQRVGLPAQTIYRLVVGPVSRPEFVTDAGGTTRLFVTCRRIENTTASGACLVLSGETNQVRPREGSLAGTSYEGAAVQLTVLERCDGLPDDCGSPPPPPPPNPTPPVSPDRPEINVNIEFPDIGPIEVTFAPTIGITYTDNNYDVRVPVTVNIKAPDLNLDFDIDVDINLSDPTEEPDLPPEPPPRDDDGRPNPPDCPPPTNCDEPPIEEPEAPDEPPPPQAENGDELEVTGCIVRTASIGPLSRATQISQDENPDIYAPALGYVNFAYESVDESIVWGADIPVKNVVFVASAPKTGLKCVDVRGTPGKDIEWDLFAIQQKVESNKCR